MGWRCCYTPSPALVSDVIGFFEIDLSTEGRKQILGKLPGYWRLLSEQSYCRYFRSADNAVVRIFWICRSDERVRSICERVANESVAQFFRFTTITDFTAKSALTVPIWQDVVGKRREILRLSAGR